MTLREKLEAGRFVMTAEGTPPVSMARSDLVDRARALPMPSTSPTAPERGRISAR